jgi:hypothetical protein
VKCFDILLKKGKPKCEEVVGTKYSLCDPARAQWVLFDSEGGDVNEAIKIGRFLRAALAKVTVSGTGRCFSACFLAVVGAIEIYSGDRIGIHRPFGAPDKLKRVNSSDYESYYNSVKGEVWQYLLDMDVPVNLIEKMFSVPSSDLYFLTENDLGLLSHHPAYEEWIAAQCPKTLSRSEEQDFYVDHNARMTGRQSPIGKGYSRYLRERYWGRDDCMFDARWQQLTIAMANHLSSK